MLPGGLCLQRGTRARACDVRCALGDAGFLWEPPAAQAIFAFYDVDHVVRGEDRAHPVDHTAPSDFTYADDSCFCCVFRSNVGVAAAVLGACVIVADVLLRRGMIVNWGRGKSVRCPTYLRFVAPCPSLPGAICSLSMVARLPSLALPAWCTSSGLTCILALMCVREAPWASPLLPGSVRTLRPCPC